MSDTSYLDDVADKYNVSEQMNQYISHLRELEYEMMCTEEAFKKAKAKRDEFATKVLPEFFAAQGVASIKCEDGARIDIVTQTKASIKKGNDDGESAKASIATWLRSHGAESLIKSKCYVPAAYLEQLKQTRIPFEEKVDINTNSLKAYIIDALGQNGSPATITPDDIPQGLSFYQWNEAKVNYGN